MPGIVAALALRARAPGISDGTVKNHLAEIPYKLDARGRTHAVLKAIRARLL